MRISPPSSSDDRHALLDQLDRALDDVAQLHPLSEQRFLETHVLYEGRSDQQRRIIGWFAEQHPPNLSTGERPFRVLSVGCGSGILDVPVAEHLASATNALAYVGVDPNAVECHAFVERFNAAAIDGAALHVEAVPFEAFEDDEGFDLVHLVHCLYYLPDPTAALMRARSMVRPGGQLVVVVAPCEALNDLSVRFYDKGYGRPTPFAEDFAALFDRLRWSFTQHRIDARVDVTPMLDGDVATGLALRDFIVQFDTTRLPETVQHLVDRYLRAIAEVTPRRSTIAHPVDVFVIDE